MKIIGALRRTLAGDNKTGQILHGVVDILPIPNQFIGKLFKAVLSEDTQKVKEELSNAFTLRNIIAILASVAFLFGLITIEDAKNLIEMIVNMF